MKIHLFKTLSMLGSTIGKAQDRLQAGLSNVARRLFVPPEDTVRTSRSWRHLYNPSQHETPALSRSQQELIDMMRFTGVLSSQLHGMTDETKIFQTIIAQFRSSDAYTGGIFLLSPDGKKLTIFDTTLDTSQLDIAAKILDLNWRTFEADVHKSKIFNCVVTQQTTVATSVGEILDDLFPHAATRLAVLALRYEKRKSILAPLICFGKTVGLFSMTSPTLSEYFMPSVQNLSRHITSALEAAAEHNKRLKTEKELRKSETLFRTIYDAAPIGVVRTTDRTGRILNANAAFRDMFGYSESELRDMTFADISHPGELEENLRLFNEMRLGKRNRYRLEKRYYHKDGSVIWGDLTVSAARDNDGNFLYTIAMVKNITERKKAEEETQQNLRLHWLLADIASRFVGTLDLDQAINSTLIDTGSFIGADRAFIFLLREDGNGNAVLENTHSWKNPRRPPPPNRIQRFHNLKPTAVPMLIQQLRDGNLVNIRDVSTLSGNQWQTDRDFLSAQDFKAVLIQPLMAGDRLLGFMGLSTAQQLDSWSDDAELLLTISAELTANAIRARQMQQKVARVQKRAADLERDAAVASMVASLSHALKNTGLELAACIESEREGFVKLRAIHDLLRAFETTGAADYRHSLRYGDATLNQMLDGTHQLTNTLAHFERALKTTLSFSRANKDKPEAINARQVFQELAFAFEKIALSKSIALHADIDALEETDGIFMVESDFRDVIRNLLMNAIEAFPSKISSPSDRTINLVAIKNGHEIQITITDTGTGIESKRLEELFHHAVISYKPGGTGLGLRTVKESVDNAGGTIAINSTLGKGTTVTVRLPRTAFNVEGPTTVEQARGAQISPEEASKYTVMHIEDNPINRRHIENRLKRLGFNVVSFSDPSQALQTYQEMSPKPQIVLTDESMPEMKGHQLIERIAALPESKSTRFAIFSGNALMVGSSDRLMQVIKGHKVLFIEKGEKLDIFDNKVTGMATGLPHTTTRPRSAIIDNPFALFAGRIVHKINNSLTGLLTSIDLLQFGGDDEDFIFMRQAHEELNAIIDELVSFAYSAPHLTTTPTIADTRLPMSLKKDNDMKDKVWDKTPSYERYKLAAFTHLYCENGLLDLRDKLERYVAQDRLNDDELMKMGEIVQAIKNYNNAVALSPTADRELVEKFRLYYDLLPKIKK